MEGLGSGQCTKMGEQDSITELDYQVEIRTQEERSPAIRTWGKKLNWVNCKESLILFPGVMDRKGRWKKIFTGPRGVPETVWCFTDLIFQRQFV